MRFLQRLLRWYWGARWGATVSWSGPEKLTVLLLNYRRSWNMEMLVRSFLRCSFVERVLLWNNGVPSSLQGVRVIENARVSIDGMGGNQGTIARFYMAQRERGTHFLAVDDDVFLFPSQVRTLFSCLVADPHHVHGVVGQQVGVTGEVFEGREEYSGTIDILSRVYTFTQEHLNEFFQLLECLGMHDEVQFQELTAGDDIVLSFCGEGKPLCHCVGTILSCPTCALPGIAVFKEPGFWDYRSRLFRQLCSLPSSRHRCEQCMGPLCVPGRV